MAIKEKNMINFRPDSDEKEIWKDFIHYRELNPLQAGEISKIFKILVKALDKDGEEYNHWFSLISPRNNRIYVFSAGEKLPPQLYIGERVKDTKDNNMAFVFFEEGIGITGSKPVSHGEIISELLIPKFREASLELSLDYDFLDG